MSVSGGLDRAVERGAGIGCETIQIFLKNNMQWRGRPLGKREARRFQEAQQTHGVRPVFAHSSYLINLAATNAVFLRRSRAALIDEIGRASRLAVPFIVIHPGAHMGAGEAAGLQRIVESLDAVFDATAEHAVRIALETTAGQGSSLGCRFEHLAEIRQRIRSPQRLAVCFDTCHLMAAGYDLRTRRAYERTMGELERVIGRQHVVACHLNDSKTAFDARVDRHEHIGQGTLGLAPFRHVLRDPRWQDLPMVLETPKEADLQEDVMNLRVLRRLLRKS